MAKPIKKLFPIYLTESQKKFIEDMSEITEDSKNGYVVSLIDKELKRAERSKG